MIVVIKKKRYIIYNDDGSLRFKSAKLNVGAKMLKEIAMTWIAWRA